METLKSKVTLLVMLVMAFAATAALPQRLSVVTDADMVLQGGFTNLFKANSNALNAVIGAVGGTNGVPAGVVTNGGPATLSELNLTGGTTNNIFEVWSTNGVLVLWVDSSRRLHADGSLLTGVASSQTNWPASAITNPPWANLAGALTLTAGTNIALYTNGTELVLASTATGTGAGITNVYPSNIVDTITLQAGSGISLSLSGTNLVVSLAALAGSGINISTNGTNLVFSIGPSVAVEAYYASTNVWSGPTNPISFRFTSQGYVTYTPIDITGFADISNSVVNGTTLVLSNAAATNITVTATGVRFINMTNQTPTVAPGAIAEFAFKYVPYPLTTNMYQGQQTFP